MSAFVDAQDSGALHGKISKVISNRPAAKGLEVASSLGIPTETVDHTEFPDRETFDAALCAAVDRESPDLVILAGFMRILTPVFTRPFKGRLMNIHPSLLPAYPGLNTHQRAIENGDRAGGATVHYVTDELDGGPPVLQAQVPILEGDTAATLAERVLPVEHRIYPVAASWHLSGRLKLDAGGAYFDGKLLPPTGADWSIDQ